MTTPHSFLLRSWPAVLLFVVSLGFTPGRAAAECGDYIGIRNAPPGSTHHSSTTNIDRPIPDGLGTPNPLKQPCHGPNCSSSPVREFPPLAPITPVSTWVKEVAQPFSPLDAEITTAGSLDRDLTSPRPIHRASSVFHPPRLG
ncbi:MAG TPA: hypothetical protein VG122_11460 [Gemmata sp.]|nr:hypothetical protein [Gemmata sp.]